MTQTPDRPALIKPEPLVIARTFTAARALVFQAWSSADHMRRWFCPERYAVAHATIDFRPGGVCEICMQAPDGQTFWSKGHYIEIVAAERLVFTTGLVGDDDQPRFTALTTVTFEDDAGGTRMTVHQAYDVFDPAAMASIDGAPEGWRTTLDRLEQEVARIEIATKRGVTHDAFTIERIYAASPAKVFHALTDPEAKARWFGGGGDHQIVEREMDVRPGGREHVKGRWDNGKESTFDALYFDVVPNTRLIYAYEMTLSGQKISVSLASMTLTPHGDGARLVVTEQGTFLDGYDDAGSREQGTRFLLDQLGTSIGG